MAQPIRCPKCSTRFSSVSSRPTCPQCGLVARVQSQTAPASAASSVPPPASAPVRSSARVKPLSRPPSRTVRRDRVIAAIAVTALLLLSGIVTTALLGNDKAKASAPGSLDDAPPLVGGIGGVIQNTSAPPASVSSVTDNATVGGAGPEGAPPAQLRFEGSGDDVTSAFTTEQGLLKVTIVYLGDGYFRASFINLDDANASRRALSAPGDGDYEGSRYIGLAPGRYTVDVRSGDDRSAWVVTIDQPRAAEAPGLPAARSGAGDTADLAFDAREGSVAFETTHSAELGEFVVRLYDAQGNLVRRGGSEAIVSDYGDHSGTVTVNLPADGVYFVDVQAAGDWSVRVRQA